jgi:uncharacterized RDD family membrane protein YckC
MYTVQHDFAVLSPDKAVITYRIAGVPARALSHVLDLILVAGLISGATFLLALTPARIFAFAIVPVLFFVLGFGYFILSEVLMNGQTLGKKSAHLRVRMADGTPVTWNAVLARNLLRIADILPGMYLLGMLCMFTNPKGQRLGDMLAGTVVVAERRDAPRYVLAPHRAGIHPLETHVGTLPGMTTEEYHALKRLADRFPELPQRIQMQLLEELWLPFAQRRKVPQMPQMHPIYQVEAVVMKYGRENGLL